MRYARPVLAVLLLAMLATPLVMRRLREGPPPAAAGDALARYGFRLTESARASGIDFVHQAPTLDPKLAHIMPQVTSMGAAVSVADFDRDGHADFYLTDSKEGSRNRLYRNRGDGTFEDVADRVGLADLNAPPTGVSMGAVWGDYDNDGFEDVLLYRWGKQELFRNDGGKAFVRVEGAGLPAWANVNTALWLDYDRDGRLDLFLGGYYSEDGRFEETSEKVGLSSRRWALAAVAADLRQTGYPDLFIANDYGVSELFVNEGGRFREVGRETGVGFAPKSGMNASVGDPLNQGRFAIYVSNISEEGILLQGNNLWVPAGEAKGGLPRYENMATAMGVDLGGWSFGAQWGDLDNDGHADLYLANGYVSASKEANYWYDYSKVAGGHELVISDAKNWPPMGDRSLAGYQPKRVWRNDGAGHFVDVAQMVGASDHYDGRAVALVDLGNRGALDVLVANQRGPLLLYRNEVAPGRDWIAFDLEGACRAEAPPEGCTNRSAIGALVTVHWKGGQQVQTVAGGSGFCAQNQRRLHFGLGPSAAIDKAVVRWPSGRTTELPAPAVNRVHEVKEPA
jgi:hypothetical protein